MNSFDYLLVDGSNLLFKSTWAFAELRTDYGEMTGAVHGFLSTLLSLNAKLEGPKVIVAWEGHANWRYAAYSGYKANRADDSRKAAFDVKAAALRQKPLLKELLDYLDIQQLRPDDGEADDVINTAATRLIKDNGARIAVLSQDKDLFQLASLPDLVVARNEREKLELVDSNGVVERMGVLPELVPDLKALAGDPSDNIPGVPRIGGKTAVKLLQAHGNALGVVKAASRKSTWGSSESHRENVLKHQDDVALYRRLACLTQPEIIEDGSPGLDLGLASDLLSRLQLVVLNDQLVRLASLGGSRVPLNS